MNGRDSSERRESTQQFLPWPSDVISQGAGPSNTAPLVSHSGAITGGLDWLQVSCYGGFEEEAWPALLCDLDNARAIAEETGELQRVRDVNGQPVLVRAAGARHGGFYCRWVLKWMGIELHVVAGGRRHDSRPTVVVVLTSEVLMAIGDRVAWERALALLEALHFRMVRDLVSRVDLCVDLVDVCVSEFVEAFQSHHYIAQARKWSMHGEGRHCTGFSLGRNIVLRVYDKLTECREKGSDAKWAALVERWGKEPRSATRVEFQCRRDSLREQWSVAGVEDLFEKLPSIATWLCETWFRLTDGVPENNHHARLHVHPLWKVVKEKFLKWAGEGGRGVVRALKKAPLPKKLIDQARGCLASALASVAPSDREWSEVMVEIIDWLEKGKERLLSDVRVRRRELIAVGAVVPYSFER